MIPKAPKERSTAWLDREREARHYWRAASIAFLAVAALGVLERLVAVGVFLPKPHLAGFLGLGLLAGLVGWTPRPFPSPGLATHAARLYGIAAVGVLGLVALRSRLPLLGPLTVLEVVAITATASVALHLGFSPPALRHVPLLPHVFLHRPARKACEHCGARGHGATD